MEKPTGVEDLAAYYQAGIGVAAAKLDVWVRFLSVGHDRTAERGLPIEPLDERYGQQDRCGPSDLIEIEDYLTVCLSGSAARFIRSEARRAPVSRAIGGAGPEVKQLRQVWKCLEPETERALVIALAFLRDTDDGDAEASQYRLWQRAVRRLRASPQREQLDRLARQLLKAGQMTGDEVNRFVGA